MALLGCQENATEEYSPSTQLPEREPRPVQIVQTPTLDRGNPFAELYQAIEEVAVHYLSSYTRPEPFSIAVGDYSDFEVIQRWPLPPESLARLEKRLADRWEHYVSPTEVHFPKNGAITTKNGESISVFVITGIYVVNTKKVRISWDYGSGFLTGIGGTYEVTRKSNGWKMESVGTDYDR